MMDNNKFWAEIYDTLFDAGYYPIKEVEVRNPPHYDNVTIGMRIPFNEILMDKEIEKLKELLPDMNIYKVVNGGYIQIEKWK